MKFSELSGYLHKLEITSSRIEITKILAELFKKAEPDEAAYITYLLLGRLVPKYEAVVFNIAEKMMLASIAKAYNRPLIEVTKKYKKEGDLGTAAQSFAKVLGDGLKVKEVYKRLWSIAVDEGEGSQERKIDETAKLLSELDPLSARYVARIPVGKLRLGFSDKTIIDAFSWMEAGDKSLRAKIESAYQVLPDVGLLAREIKTRGIEKAVENVTPKVGVPVLAMLAQRLKSPAEMIKKMGKVGVEPKLDGLRMQIHFKRSTSSNSRGVKGEEFIKAFTRNMNETSWMFPELDEIGKYIKADEVILDTEAVGVNEALKAVANFQSTMTRRRKHDIKEMAAKVRIQFYVFDILAKDSKSLMSLKYKERKEILKDTVVGGELFKYTEYTVTDSPVEVARLNVEYRKKGFEGIMIKRLDGAYVPGRTGWRWVKMKEAEDAIGKLSDTVDCVVMGYSAGRGKRATFGLGQFLVGVRSGDRFKTISKVGTGLTDEQFRSLRKLLTKCTVPNKPEEYDVNKILEPDYWVFPEIVVEIAADEITKSPSHTTGLALRFPRLVKFRQDKSPNEATTTLEVEKLFELYTQ